MCISSILQFFLIFTGLKGVISEYRNITAALLDRDMCFIITNHIIHI